MTKLISLGAGAGLVAALLFAVVATGSPLSLLLCYAAPLPIVIVSLGWTHLVGLLAVAVGALATSFALHSGAGLAFALGPALPAWALSYIVLLGFAPVVGSRRSEPALSGPPLPLPLAWPSAGYILFGVGLVSALVALASAVALGGGNYAALRATLREVTESLMRAETGGSPSGALPSLGGLRTADIVSLLIRVAPAVAGGIFTLALTLNLWVGGKAVAVSGRLPRPWPSIPETRMPPAALAGLVGGAVLVFAPGFAGVAGIALVGALTMAFALQGLALLHHVTRGRSGRSALLTFAYILTVFFGGTFLPLMALAGMADTATPLRRRLVREPVKGGPPNTPTSHT